MNVFILTRFNIRLWWNHDKSRVPVQTAEWLDERFRLFEKYTLPSVKAQDYQGLHWICLFDDQTPEKYRSRIAGYGVKCSFDACFVSELEAQHFQDIFRKRIKELADVADEDLLTIYLDSDDCLRNNYISDLISQTKCNTYNTVFSYIYGIQYYEENNLAVRIPYPNNHFLAYYERMNDNIRTVWGFWHFSIFRYKKVNIVTVKNGDMPMWIEVIHQCNVDNDVKMTLHQMPILNRDTLRYFGLEWLLEKQWKTCLLYATVFQFRFAQQIVRRMVNKLKKEN